MADRYENPLRWLYMAFAQAVAIGFDLGWASPITLAVVAVVWMVGIHIYERGERSRTGVRR